MTQQSAGRHSRSEHRPSGPVIPRIAVDLLGGDNAPAVVVDGALRAGDADPDLEFLLVGPPEVAGEVVAALDSHRRRRVAVLAVERGVGMTDPVGHGADTQTSIGAAVLALASHRVDAVISAGASGATVAAAVMCAGRLVGARRPALAAILPGLSGPLILLDVGAGLQVNPVDLVQHASLGAAYARCAAGVAAPRVGLLSVGSERGKGDPLRRAADAALRVHHLPGATYVGPVEGDDVVTGARADVVVTDGFTGNVLLKGVEAALTGTLGSSPSMSVPRAAALLGVCGTIVVCHGVADADDVASGVALAARLVRDGVVGRLAGTTGLATISRRGADSAAQTDGAETDSAAQTDGAASAAKLAEVLT